MNKMNKKGFTLIEMLVVIAIIAVLVSIIIPTVTNATDRAAAATNAANLRSVKAELATAILTDTTSVSGLTLAESTTEDGTYTITGTHSNAKFKDLKSVTLPTGYTAVGSFDAAKNLEITIVKDVITAKYDGLTINDWAAIAE